MPSPTRSHSHLIDAIQRYQLLEQGQLEQLPDLKGEFSGPAELARALIERNWLTRYQADKLLSGRGGKLVLGPYLLLDRLGKGGMGRVYKAMHRRMKRLVVLKLIRCDKACPDVWQRFRREIQAVAQLNHPNVVKALDAAEVRGKLLLVMEYVDGSIDLADLVLKAGPLPVEQACDFVAQAAQGLQHAFESGLVHRDIKPSNLLLTGNGGTIKVLDLGLARLRETEDDAPMTRVGSVLGTPDYMAPEQARESHGVDIRADIYSLGCTLYFLLTGQVPFPTDSTVKKLLMHQSDLPRPLESLCRQVPDAVAAVVRKMMAKGPHDRYQEPRDAATALREALAAPSKTPNAAAAAEVKLRTVRVDSGGELRNHLVPGKDPKAETCADRPTVVTAVERHTSPRPKISANSSPAVAANSPDARRRKRTPIQENPFHTPPEPADNSADLRGLNLDSTASILGRRHADGKGRLTVLLAVAGALSLFASLVFIFAR